jgi:hypothetical protein
MPYELGLYHTAIDWKWLQGLFTREDVIYGDDGVMLGATYYRQFG